MPPGAAGIYVCMTADDLTFTSPPSARGIDSSDRLDEAWEQLYEEQLPRVYNFFRYRIGRIAEAEDLTAVTFEKAWRSRQRYRRDIAAFSTWLMTIARHVASNHLRSRRMQLAPLEDASEVQAESTPEDQVSRDSDRRRLLVLLDRLPDRHREIVALKFGSGLSNQEIASVTGLSESNVGTILHRIGQSLRSQWEGGEIS
jgi:RNA polymerase sigma-70 factor, ECF subfamily